MTITGIYPEDTIPLPFIDYSGEPRNGTVVSDLDKGYIYRRSRFTSAFVTLKVSWILTNAQYASLRTFFLTTLYNGARVFKMPLKYPGNTSLDFWAVRIVGGLEAERDDVYWIVSTSLDLIRKYEGAYRVTEVSDTRITEEGDTRVVQLDSAASL